MQEDSWAKLVKDNKYRLLTDRALYRTSGMGYIQVKSFWYPSNEGMKLVYVIMPSEVARIAKKHNMEGKCNLKRLQGRLAELVVARELYALLKPYAKQLGTANIRGGKIHRIIEECFTTNGQLVDLVMPSLSKHYDVKSKHSKPHFFSQDITSDPRTDHARIDSEKMDVLRSNNIQDIEYITTTISDTLLSATLDTSLSITGTLSASDVLDQAEGEDGMGGYPVRITKKWEDVKKELIEELKTSQNARRT